MVVAPRLPSMQCAACLPPRLLGGALTPFPPAWLPHPQVRAQQLRESYRETAKKVLPFSKRRQAELEVFKDELPEVRERACGACRSCLVCAWRSCGALRLCVGRLC